MCNMRPIYNRPITTEQYLWEKIEKGLDVLEDTFTEARSVEQDQVFQPYTTHTDTYTA